jgi:3-dehydroquinate synthase class II
MIQFRVGDEVETKDFKGRVRRGRVYRIDTEYDCRMLCVEFQGGGTIKAFPSAVRKVVAQRGELPGQEKEQR